MLCRNDELAILKIVFFCGQDWLCYVRLQYTFMHTWKFLLVFQIFLGAFSLKKNNALKDLSFLSVVMESCESLRYSNIIHVFIVRGKVHEGDMVLVVWSL